MTRRLLKGSNPGLNFSRFFEFLAAISAVCQFFFPLFSSFSPLFPLFFWQLHLSQRLLSGRICRLVVDQTPTSTSAVVGGWKGARKGAETRPYEMVANVCDCVTAEQLFGQWKESAQRGYQLIFGQSLVDATSVITRLSAVVDESNLP